MVYQLQLGQPGLSVCWLVVLGRERNNLTRLLKLKTYNFIVFTDFQRTKLTTYLILVPFTLHIVFFSYNRMQLANVC